MNQFEIIPALSFEGFENEGEGEGEDERGRTASRARPAARRSAPSRSRAQRPPPRAKPRPKPGPKLGQKPRPKPGQKPRPRPRPLPGSWPPYGAGLGLPWVVERADAAALPSGDATSGAPGAGDERWRCVQACFNRASGAAPGAAPAPEPAPEPATGGDTTGDDPSGGDTSAGGNAGAAAPEPTPEEFEFGQAYAEYEAEYEGGYEAEFEVAPGLLTLPAAIADPRAAGPGIYTLFKEGQRVYVGRADDLRRRLQQHLLCLTHLKLKASRFHVKLTPLRGFAPGHRARVESAVIDRFGRTAQGGGGQRQSANAKSREF